MVRSVGASIARWVSGAALSVMVAGAQAQGLPAELSDAWRKTGLPESSASFVIEKVQGARIAGLNVDEPRNPASVMKLITTWSALSDLGPDFVWQTAFLTDAKATVSDQGVLSGNLYLRPSGDPMLLLEDLWRLMRELRLRGITQIGDVIVDRSLFSDVAIDPGEFDGRPDRPYNASPDAFMVGFGAIRLVFTPDAQRNAWRGFIDPGIPGIDIDSDIQWLSGPCRSAPQVSLETIVTGDQVRFRAAGRAHGSCGEFDMYRLAFDQQTMAAKVLKTMWEEIGGSMTGQVRAGQVPADAVPVAAHESPPLAEVIRFINKRSNNVMTRVLLLTIGAQSGLRPSTIDGSVNRIKAVLGRQGLDFSTAVIENGSGLSRNASVSANQLAAMLQTAWRSPSMPEFLSSMAILGVDGTLRRRLRGPETKGYANMKTGALRDVRAIAGYVLSASGDRYVFVSMVNHPESYKAREFENTVMQWLIERRD
ncbi:D-alanyl-D-alanine carboxypeptidase/D-alanyl-D-alanine endopeptidase [Orrella marina]|uniref:D-alanyl-D-alanine carboxypeptidase/D-alanyl-D-alanine-endopeptidase n=1 Tax=Orrella marina TaxID=2163011 RepID=A0A2R4XIP0_9BURK|nr:D-alanyl-D-alanine carboxypeptidase/D-alanyl-D-alanine-endopeptidase [Orrella marina]AWB33682.1 D-alanyl-D-alanine carboxypeptidase/D-alanyl-D-alanine-endopeptidase [Orrella marina]